MNRAFRFTLLGLAGVILLIAAVTAAARSPQLYSGSARSLMPTVSESKYNRLMRSKRVSPSSGKRVGFRSGWESSYRDTIATTVNQADVLVYVFNTRANALRAYADACPRRTCRTLQMRHGIRGKQLADISRTPAVGIIATCANLYIAVITASTTETPSQLTFNARYEIGVVYGKAVAKGMGACK